MGSKFGPVRRPAGPGPRADPPDFVELGAAGPGPGKVRIDRAVGTPSSWAPPIGLQPEEAPPTVGLEPGRRTARGGGGLTAPFMFTRTASFTTE